MVEEKGAIVETQLRALFYNAPADQRPVLLGKADARGRPLISALGELRPLRLIEIVAAWLARHAPGLDRHEHVRDFTAPDLLSNAGDSVKRQPYFCAGCPHNTSTRVPDGSTARAGIGCHFMANWMDRSTAGLIQMGGEGVDWVSHAMFTKLAHFFQNLGDGTYYHSGYLAIRQAVAAQATLTYKILFNDAVAMTGGQPMDGVISVDAIARQVESEGVKQVVVLSDDIGKYDAIRGRFPAGTEFHDRDALDAVQRRLRQMPGVTVLIYEQTCAAEKRRRRKKGGLLDPDKRLFINQAVCDGCGDCGVQSNCVAVLPLGACRATGRAFVEAENGLSLGAKHSHALWHGEHLQRRVSPFSASTRRAGVIFGAIRRCRLVVGPRQRGLVPVGLPALARAIELNGVAVQSNYLALALGRLAAADPQACRQLRDGSAEPAAPAAHAEPLAALIERAAAHLTAYQDAAWAGRYHRQVDQVQRRESALGADADLPLTRAAATGLRKLMTYKDEYEMARLYTDGQFRRLLAEQFESQPRLQFHMAPPLLARPTDGQAAKKITLGP